MPLEITVQLKWQWMRWVSGGTIEKKKEKKNNSLLILGEKNNLTDDFAAFSVFETLIKTLKTAVWRLTGDNFSWI